MNSKPSGLSRFVSELRRRHVFRVTVAYAAVAFVVLQAAEIVIPAFGLQAWVLQLVVVLATLGLPVVAALAWVYEITPRGIRTMRELDAESGIPDAGAGDLAPRLALLVTTVAAVTGAGWWWYRASVPEATVSEPAAEAGFVAPAEDADEVPIRSLAVLPLDDFSPGGGQDYFAAGMHEALISQLSQLGTVRVISRTSVNSYDRTGKSAVQVGRELGVEGLVEGSVTASGDSVRVTIQLIHAPSDTHLWAGEYDGALEDILVVQREVARAITTEIEGELGSSPENTPVLAAGDLAPTKPEAAREEMIGRHMLVQGAPGDLEQAASHFEEALREDPGYAPALTSLAGLELLRGLDVGVDSLRGTDAVASAEEYVERALESDPDSREAHELRALIDGFQRDFRWSFETPVEAGDRPRPPPDVQVRVFGSDSGTVVVAGDSLGHYVPAVTEIGARVLTRMAEFQAGMGAAPHRLRAARSLMAVGRWSEAEDVLRQTVEETPELAEAWDALEHVLVTRSELEAVVELREERRAVRGLEAPDAPSVEALDDAVDREGARGYWRWRLRELEARRAAGEEVSPVMVAAARAELGDTEEALLELTRAAERGDPHLVTLRTDPAWDPLRDDPRFRRLARGVVEFRRPGAPGG